MNIKTLALALSLTMMASSAWALTETSTAEGTGIDTLTGPNDADLSITPQLGVFGYSDASGNYTSRFSEGLTLTWLSEGVSSDPYLYFGLNAGIIHSHMGATSADFFGSQDDGLAGSDSNALIFPLEVALGYKLTDTFVLSGLAGINMIYLTNSTGTNLGRGDFGKADGDFEVFPSLGVYAGWEVSRVTALGIRGDYIPTPNDDMFTAALGATFALAE